MRTNTDPLEYIGKNWMSIVFIAVFGVAIYLVVKLFKNGVFGTLNGLLGGNKILEEEKGQYIPKRVNLIPQVTADSLASRLYNAFDRFGTNNDEVEAVYQVIKKYAAGGIVDVSNSFGLKYYSLVGTVSVFSVPMGVPLNLSGWVQRELSGDVLVKWLKLFSDGGL
jgi:hypothetical protein